MNGLTPTEQEILRLLADGLPHSLEEMLECIPDELAGVRTLHVHVSRLRKKLPPGQDILCEFARRRTHYRHVRLLPSAYDGVR